jgi:hypothetical protein
MTQTFCTNKIEIGAFLELSRRKKFHRVTDVRTVAMRKTPFIYVLSNEQSDFDVISDTIFQTCHHTSSIFLRNTEV